MASVRQQKVASSIEAWLHGALLQERYRDHFDGVRIVAVEMSRDLSLARIWVVASNGALAPGVLKQLNELCQTLRYEMANHLAIKKLPRLRFFEDQLTAENDRLHDLFVDLFPNGLDAESH